VFKKQKTQHPISHDKIDVVDHEGDTARQEKKPVSNTVLFDSFFQLQRMLLREFFECLLSVWSFF
jgi:hypothetical protein